MPCSSRRPTPTPPPRRTEVPVKRHPHPICLAPSPAAAECQLQAIRDQLEQHTTLLREICLLLHNGGNNL